MGQPPRSGDTLTTLTPWHSGQQGQHRDVEGAHHGEVTAVEGGDLAHAGALSQRDHRGVRRPERRIGIPFHQLRRPPG